VEGSLSLGRTGATAPDAFADRALLGQVGSGGLGGVGAGRRQLDASADGAVCGRGLTGPVRAASTGHRCKRGVDIVTGPGRVLASKGQGPIGGNGTGAGAESIRTTSRGGSADRRGEGRAAGDDGEATKCATRPIPSSSARREEGMSSESIRRSCSCAGGRDDRVSYMGRAVKLPVVHGRQLRDRGSGAD
jgi:hypothetical protein